MSQGHDLPDLSSLSDDHLGALVQALHEARFQSDSLNTAFSPLVVDLHAGALEEQQRRDSRPDSAEQWDVSEEDVAGMVAAGRHDGCGT